MRASHLEDFYQFLRFPSVSTDDHYTEKVTECGHWLVEKLTEIGLSAKLCPTPGHPVVWATDNKGQILSHILGVQEQIEASGDLPVNLHFVIEGEEEIGSANLGNFLSQNREALKPEIVVVSDTGMISRGVPTMSYGLRGVAALELKITGPKMDLHSGIYGGAVANPLTAMARLLATLHDANGHIAVPGFYDEVLPLEDWEREMWRKIPVNVDEEIVKETGVPELFGEKGFSTWERI